MTLSYRCHVCGSEIEGRDVGAFGDAFIAHARSEHPDWPYSDTAIRNFAEATQRLTGSRTRQAVVGAVTVELVTEALLDDWLSFFDHDVFADNPAWASCYCVEPHLLEPGGWPDDSGDRHWQWYRKTMVDLLRASRVHGYLAFVEGKPAGWVNASLRSEYALYRRGPGIEPADGDVIGVSCFAIAPPYRRHGTAARLLDRVLADAPERGATHIEAYPFKEETEEDARNFRGPRSLLLSRGFEPVDERERYVVMRRRV